MNRIRNMLNVIECQGLGWVLFRAAYALKKRGGWFERRLPRCAWEDLPLPHPPSRPDEADADAYFIYRTSKAPRFFFAPEERKAAAALFRQMDSDTGQNSVAEAEQITSGVFKLFGRHSCELGIPPDWFKNDQLIDDTVDLRVDWSAAARVHWSRINEFNSGDIKTIWELSRFGFAYPLVRAYWRTGDEQYAETFWRLLEDWRSCNPPNTGPHWICGQEISIRMMAWCFGLYGFLTASSTTPARVQMLAQMIDVSAQRVEGNIAYALAQHNNHGISEATGLWTVGLLFPEFKHAARWHSQGITLLSKLAAELIYEDGCFAQHSVNYHRVMLDNLLWAIQLARKNDIEMPKKLTDRVTRAGDFLAAVTQKETGQVPCLGAQDGSLLLPLTSCDRNDYRPVVQSVRLLLEDRSEYDAGPWDEMAFWLKGFSHHTPAPPVESLRSAPDFTLFEQGGCLAIQMSDSQGLLRCPPHFRHRPSHADLLHFDLWYKHINVLRDGGTFSYNGTPSQDTRFSTVQSHNTVEFDNHDQMPHLSRFLYGKWPKGLTLEAARKDGPSVSYTGAYRDWTGARHTRRLVAAHNDWTITDTLEGFHEKAILRWHLSPEISWDLEGNCCSGHGVRLLIDTSASNASIRLVHAWESRYYLEQSRVPVLEIEIKPACREVTTVIKLGDS